MHLTVLNLTADSLVFSYGHASSTTQELLALPSLPSTVTFSKSRSATLSLGDEKTADWETVKVSSFGTCGASWKEISAPNDCLWRVYILKVTSKHRKLIIVPRRNLASFLSEMPDRLPLSSLLLPGTHDTMAFYGWPFSQCQSLATPLSVQFSAGIRVVDIRLTPVNGRLIAYHGAYPQKTPFQDILKSAHDFLTSPAGSRETIIMSIKQEAPAPEFSQLVHDEIAVGAGGRDMWFLESKIPTLKEARGKVVLFSRFGNGDGWEGGLNGMGIHPTNWPDSVKEGFEWMCNDIVVRTSDWYHIPSFLSIPEKVVLSTEVLQPSPAYADRQVLPITFFSASSFPLAAPPTISQGFGWPSWGMGVEGVNSRVAKWALEQLAGSSSGDEKAKVTEPTIRGWTFMDYFTEPDNALVPLLVEFNFRGREPAQEGWRNLFRRG